MDKELQKTAEKAQQPWGAIAALVVGVAAYIVSQLAVGLAIIPFLNGHSSISTVDIPPWVSLILTAISSSIMLGVVWIFLRSKKFKISSFGFKKPTLRQVGLTVLAYILYFVVYLGVLFTVIALVPNFNADQAQDVGFVGAKGWQLILAFIGLVIIAPISEEIFFRGFLYRGFRRSWPIWLSAIVTSILFAFAHGQWNVALDVFVLSLLLIFVYQKTNNLWLCIAMHASKNLIAFLFLFVFTT